MGIKKFKKCSHCEKELPANKNYFKRIKNKETSKEELSNVCRECENKLLLEENWKDGKLKCFICGEYLDEDNFSHSENYEYRNHKDKRCTKCKTLQNKLARSKYSDDQKLEKTLRNRLDGAKRRAIKKNIPFDLDLEFIRKLWDEQRGLCKVSKLPMTYTLDSGRTFSNVSIDQINPSLGYTRDNIQLVCMSINQLKSDFDMNTVLLICSNVVKNYENVK